MRIALVNHSSRGSGMGKFALELHEQLNDKCSVEHIFLNYEAREIDKISKNQIECLSKFRKYPIDYKYLFCYRIQKRIPAYDLYHITTQNLSFLKLEPKIVTCYDMFYHALPMDRDVLYHRFPIGKLYKVHANLVLSGIAKAARVITISEFSKNQIVEYLNYPEDKIKVIYEGVDHKMYKPTPKEELILEKYGIPKDQKLILYVGSEHPRKNLPILLKAFHKLKASLGNIKLIKVGQSDFRGGRKKLLQLIRELDLGEDIVFTEYVPEEDLPKLYNAADLYVSPTIYEGGFALPVLEAMACGCPAITSNIPPLLETVSDGGILIDPNDVNGIASAMYNVLTNEALKQDMIEKGLRRAQMFSWERAAQETLKVYQEVYEGLR